jgi:hypothetical protein
VRDECPTCGNFLIIVDATDPDDKTWLAECELGHLVSVEIPADELDVPVRLFGLLLAVLYLLAAYIETPLV